MQRGAVSLSAKVAFVSQRLLTLAMLAVLMAAPQTAYAQQTSLGSLSAQLAQAETDIRAVDRSLDGRADATSQKQLRSKALAAQQASADAVRQLGEQLALIEARVAGLGSGR